jgi:hypothetical protein
VVFLAPHGNGVHGEIGVVRPRLPLVAAFPSREEEHAEFVCEAVEGGLFLLAFEAERVEAEGPGEAQGGVVV